MPSQQHQDHPQPDASPLPLIETDVLIIGAGPAGASLACFLASHGVSGIVVCSAPSTCTTPRANYINATAFECLHDCGLDEKARAVAYPMAKYGTYHRVCKSLAGEEIVRVRALESDASAYPSYTKASPCRGWNLPQHRLEPILVTYAGQNGVPTRFNSKLLSFIQHKDFVESTIEDSLTGQQIKVRSKYLCGADGASSLVAKTIGLPFESEAHDSLSIGVEIEADLSHLMQTTPGLIHVLTRPDLPQPPWGIAGLLRSVEPWSRWTVMLICQPGIGRLDITTEEMLARIRELIDDADVQITYKSHAFWRVNERIAKQYTDGRGRVFCLGDAVHQHPPHGGLGANCAIGDAFCLAWKLAYVLQNKAGPALLETYSAERQPVGEFVVRRANETASTYAKLLFTLGVFNPDPVKRVQADALFSQPSIEGEQARARFRAVVYELQEELAGVGTEFNQWYRSDAVLADAGDEPPSWPTSRRDRAIQFVESTYPGFRVPHAWLTPRASRAGPRPALVSSKVLCGRGKFTILTGIGGKAIWGPAANVVEQAFGVEVQVCSIGWGQEYEDTFSAWFEKRGVEETGCVLVRPDLTVGWRRVAGPEVEAAKELLVKVIKRLLGLTG